MYGSARASRSSRAACSQAIADAEARLGAAGRLVIRKSGTEPVIRVMAQGEDEALLAGVVDEICDGDSGGLARHGRRRNPGPGRRISSRPNRMPAAGRRAMKGRVLIIAGSDSGGGAGIQADIKTVTMLDGFRRHGDHRADGAEHARAFSGIADPARIHPATDRGRARRYRRRCGQDRHAARCRGDRDRRRGRLPSGRRRSRSSLDPVMVAKGGAPLIEPAAIDALKRLLVPRAAVLTPNLPEAEILAGRRDRERRRRCMTPRDTLLALGCRAVLLKGGHLAGDTVHDVLATETGHRVWSQRRGSRAAIPTAPAARWPRRSPPGWRRVWPSSRRSSARATMSVAPSPRRPASAGAMARSTTPTRCMQRAVGSGMADLVRTGSPGALRVGDAHPALSDRRVRRGPFTGNPAAVCPLDAWLPAETMQAIAAENNLSETAFFVPEGDGLPAALVHPERRGRSVRPCDIGLGVCRLPLSRAGRDSITFQTEKAGQADGRARRRRSRARFSGEAAAALSDVGSCRRRARQTSGGAARFARLSRRL